VGSGQTIRVKRPCDSSHEPLLLTALVREGSFAAISNYRLNVLAGFRASAARTPGGCAVVVAFFVQRFGKKFARSVNRFPRMP